jgi:hypothetical protein
MSIMNNTKGGYKWYTEWLVYGLLFLMGLLFFYTGPIVSWIIVISVAIIASRLMWKNFHYLLSRRDNNQYSPYQLLTKRIGYTLFTFMIIIVAGYAGMVITKMDFTKKTNTISPNSETNNKIESSNKTTQISPINKTPIQDTIPNNSNTKENLTKDSITSELAYPKSQQEPQNTTTNSKNISVQSLSTITAERAFFYKDTNVNIKRKNLMALKRTGSYCIRGDNVFVLETTPNWSKVNYTNNSGKIASEGWILSSDLN